MVDAQADVLLEKPHKAGFSLVEFMVVLAIAMILLCVGVPGFQHLLRQQKIATVTREFFAAINLARSEALQRGTKVDLVPANGIDWTKGWTVFVDKNGNQQTDAGEPIIFTHGPLPNGFKMETKFGAQDKGYLAYNSAGRTQAGKISFTLEQETRRIVINFQGRARICNPVNDATCD